VTKDGRGVYTGGRSHMKFTRQNSGVNVKHNVHQVKI
jgi:hypothetical protein